MFVKRSGMYSALHPGSVANPCPASSRGVIVITAADRAHMSSRGEIQPELLEAELVSR